MRVEYTTICNAKKYIRIRQICNHVINMQLHRFEYPALLYLNQLKRKNHCYLRKFSHFMHYIFLLTYPKNH